MARSPRNRLVVGDPIGQVATLADGSIDLVCIDLVRTWEARERRLPDDRAPIQLDLFEQGIPQSINRVQRSPRCQEPEDQRISRFAACLRQCHRALKTTGNCYVQCTPEDEPFLRDLLNQTFGVSNFRNQIVWKRSQSARSVGQPFAHSHELLLLYAKSHSSTSIPTHSIRSQDPESQYRFIEAATGKRYALADCVNPRSKGKRFTFEWNGHVRTWRWTLGEMRRLDAAGRLVHTRSGLPRYKRFLDEVTTTLVTSVWTDVAECPSVAGSGIQLDRPESLLARMISASSNVGDTVLDPSCGSGTAIIAAHRLDRRWIGIDATHVAIATARARLRSAFGDQVQSTYIVEGGPISVAQASAMAEQDPFQFACWALGMVGAMPISKRRSSDEGIDGRLLFEDQNLGEQQVVFSVRAGSLTQKILGQLEKIRERSGAAIAVLITLQQPPRSIRSELLTSPTLRSEEGRFARLQMLTIKDLLIGMRPRYPGGPLGGARKLPVSATTHHSQHPGPRTGTRG
jgi:hypothetical protein